MKAVILAAGEGRRLRPLTVTRPKVMIPVGGRPILEYVVSALKESGIIDIIMVVGYKREKIMDYFGDGNKWGVKITYVEQPQQLGTAHALRQASHMINDRFLVINGDNIIDASAIKEVIRVSDGDVAMLTVTVDRAQEYGVVKTQNQMVKAILEKPKGEEISKVVNAGVYNFSPIIFRYLESIEISERGEYEITDALRKMLGEGYAIKSVHTNALWMDALYLWNLLDMNAATLAKRKGNVDGRLEDGAHISGEVVLGKKSVVRSGSYIVGPVVIGDNCEIGPNVVILPGTSIGNNCTLEPFTRISNSILMDNVKIASFSDISSSIIGEGVVAGPELIIEADDTKVEADNVVMKARMGAAIGDNTEVAGRVLIKPGKAIGVRCRIGEGTTVRDNLPDNVRAL
ncbi:bifunctional sugar-1-phosphate nucleotidylyltransferase/acetyltransferase [Methanocella conradii]|uniref:bifunctional sugar-1-phosphate nucleotidylyltransferase/acetyltransferase n=1 Tax=Methanocella conradii TaxID=1175444 RepID=UPI00157DC99A|nr:bifunctional sugar-1-phosphate nucleotidylyltransferase/acetyltransferase [Methanocella conradii]